MTIFTGMKTFENLNSRTADPISVKLVQYMYHLNTFHLLKIDHVNQRAAQDASKNFIKTCEEFIKILTLVLLKTSLRNAVRLGAFPLYLTIYLQQIYWECRRRGGALLLILGVLLPNKLVSQYRCMILPKTDDNDTTHKKVASTLSSQMVNAFFWTSASYEQFKSLVLESRRPVLFEILFYKIFQALLNFFLHKLISLQDVGHHMLHFHVGQQLPSL